MTENPIAALRAILACPRELDGVVVYPLTAARYALLEAGGCILEEGEADPVLALYAAHVMTMPESRTGARPEPGMAELKAEAVGRFKDRRNLKWAKANLGELLEDLGRQLRELAYLAPEGRQEGKDGKDGGHSGSCRYNGWLTQLIYLAVQELGMKWEDAVYRTPLQFIMLMLRQKAFNDSEGKAMTLDDKELIDRMAEKDDSRTGS